MSALPREIEADSIYSHKLGRWVRYSVVLPEENCSGKVMYMFHGIGGDCTSWLEYSNIARMMENMTSRGEIEPFAVVMPDGYLSYYNDAFDGSFPYESFFVTELMPTVEKKYGFGGSRAKRAIVGFSMGGFGAASVGLRNLDKFATIVGLSMSIRTDEQYMTEGSQSGWDKQWGKTFGGVGLSGQARLTDWYKARSPYHILESIDPQKLAATKLIFDIGDSEGTLARSNDQLHRMLNARGIKHRWTVRDGGHDFGCWNAALPEVFVDFAGLENAKSVKSNKTSGNEPSCVKMDGCDFFLPFENVKSSRRYPVVYVRGINGNDKRRKLADDIMSINDSLGMAPLAVGFVDDSSDINTLVRKIDASSTKTRPSQRMRALIDVSSPIERIKASVDDENMFTAIVLVSPEGHADSAAALVESVARHKRYPRLWLDIEPENPFYDLAGEMHSLMREQDIKHEFRSSAETKNVLWNREKLTEIIRYLNERIHI